MGSGSEIKLTHYLETSLIDIVVESWRFSRLFARMINKLEGGEGSRYSNQYRYYIARLEESLDQVGMRLVNVEGQIYDPGMAVTALNIADFDADDQLLVDQMIEPIIMGAERLVHTGAATLRRVE